MYLPSYKPKIQVHIEITTYDKNQDKVAQLLVLVYIRPIN